MAAWLKNLRITKVSVVPTGANPDAHIVLFKSTDPPEVQKETFARVRTEAEQAVAVEQAWSAFLTHLDTLRVAMARTLFNPDEPMDDVSVSLSQFREATLTAIAGIQKEHSPMKNKIDRTKLTKDENDYLDSLEKSAAPAPDPTPSEDVIKALPEAVQKMLADQQALIEKAQADMAAATARAEQAAKDAAIEKEARERVDLEKEIMATFPTLPGTAAEKAATLHTVRKAVDAATYTALTTLLKAGEEALRLATAETGTNAPGALANTAYEELKALAKELVAKGEAKTEAQGFDLALSARPDLYQRYGKEKASRVQ